MATIQYTRIKGQQLTYEIQADKHGSYEIKLAGKVVKRHTVPSAYLDRPRWGSKKLEADALADASKAIEAMKTDGG
jgi:hypothetical protein